MSQPLPARPDIGWLRKLSKDRLAATRAHDPAAKLSDAQLAVAREHGFPSWRKLRAHVEQIRQQLAMQALGEQVPPEGAAIASPAEAIASDDPALAQLLAAAEAGDSSTIVAILSRRPNLANARGPQGQTPLHAAVLSDDPRLAELLLAYQADPEARYGESGHTALSWAVTVHSFAFARALVQLGSRPDLFCAAGIGSLPLAQAFFDEAGGLLPGASRTGSSRLTAGGTRLICPPEAPREQVSDALYIACRTGQVEVASFLLGKDPDLSFRAYAGGTALHWAHFGGSQAIVEMLEQAGADPTARDDSFRCTPRAFGICVPAAWGIAFLVRQRLAEDPTLANVMDGVTGPLHEAARAGNLEIVRLLLDAGASPALCDGDGRTPLDLAAAGRHEAVAELLAARIV